MRKKCVLVLFLSALWCSLLCSQAVLQQSYQITESQLQKLEMAFQSSEENRLKTLEMLRQSQIQAENSQIQAQKSQALAEKLSKQVERLQTQSTEQLENLKSRDLTIEKLNLSLSKLEDQAQEAAKEKALIQQYNNDLKLKIQKQRTKIVILSSALIMLIVGIAARIFMKLKFKI